MNFYNKLDAENMTKRTFNLTMALTTVALLSACAASNNGQSHDHGPVSDLAISQKY